MTKQELPPGQHHDPSRPFGENGPKVDIRYVEQPANPATELSTYGLDILKKVKPRQGIVSTYTLCTIMRSEGDWGGFQNNVQSLIDNGYLVKDSIGALSLTEKGEAEL